MNIAFYFSGKGTRVRKILSEITESSSDLKFLFCDNLDNEDFRTIYPSIDYYSFDYLQTTVKNSTKNEYLSNMILRHLIDYKIDYLYCWGDHILKGELIKKYKNRIINFHPSILPMFPGRKSIDQALEKNSFLIGNSAHFIDEGIDTGPVIMQSLIHSSILNFNKIDYDRVLDLQIPMFKQINEWLQNNQLVVKDKKVEILDMDYSNTYFIPHINSKFL